MGRKLVSVAATMEFEGSPIFVGPASVIRVQCDFASLLADSEFLRAATVTVYQMPQESDVSSTIAGTPVYWDTKVLVELSGFTAGKTYRVEVLADVWAAIDPNKLYENYFTVHCGV